MSTALSKDLDGPIGGIGGIRTDDKPKVGCIRQRTEVYACIFISNFYGISQKGSNRYMGIKPVERNDPPIKG